MNNYRIAALVAAAALSVSACDNHNETPPFFGELRIGNGITDSTGLDMSISDIGTFSDIGLDTASGLIDAPVGSYKAQLSSNGVSFDVDGVSIDHNNITTIFAYGTIGSGTQGGFPAEVSVDAPTNGQAVVQPVHAAQLVSATVTSLNFYFVKPGTCSTAIAGVSANGSAGFKASPPSFALAGGSYEICVTDAGNTVLFDSGPTGIKLPTSGSNVFQIAAYDAPGGSRDGSTLALSLLDNSGGNTILYNLKN